MRAGMTDPRTTTPRDSGAREITDVGVVGLGHMGTLIARNLVSAGFRVHVWDRDRSAAQGLDGAERRASPAEVAGAAHVLLTVLENDDAVREVVLGGGLLRELRERAVYADLSTTAASLAEELAGAASGLPIDVLDIEMSGSTPQAESGELALLVGGDEAVLERVRPVLDPLAANVLHMGPHGAGARMKLVVNTLLGVGMEALAEAVAFGDAVGLDRGRMLDALEQLAVVAPAHKPKIENARKGEFPVAFALRLMAKDFRLVLAAAAEAGVSMPATEASARVAERTLASADADEDFSAILRTLEPVR
jgi:3-hydroxyisobutyrate dehydrogenase-like beta-hydroxyacid dehydrogenase